MDGALIAAARPFLSGAEETFATVLLAVLLKAYGVDVLNWDPITIEAEVRRDFGVEMPEAQYQQVMALINVMTNDSVYRSIEVFDRTVDAFCLVHSGDQDMPTAEEVAWTAFEITMNDPDPYEQGENAEWPFSTGIAIYAGVVLADEGIKRKPKSLDFAIMPEWAPKGLGNDPAAFSDSFTGQANSADQVDAFVKDKFQKLTEHLSRVGTEPAPALQERADDLHEDNQLDQLFRA